MSLTTIIAIVLGIAVLVFLIFGFTTGWNNLWDRVTQFTGDSNVDAVVQACAVKCAGGDKFGYCSEERELKNGTATIKSTCEDLKSGIYGIADCPGISC